MLSLESKIKMKPKISKPWSQAIGPSSPVQQAISWLIHFFKNSPTPDLNTSIIKSNGALLATHLLHLLNGCGFLNGAGLHSSAVSMLRSLEDALDCFGAVVFVNGAAEKWANRTLKASEAAKLWTPLVQEISIEGISLSDYRKKIRSLFNDYSHCSYDLCLWNLFFCPKDNRNGKTTGTLELNLPASVINQNGHSIDAHLTAHLLEFMLLVKKAYSREFNKNKEDIKSFDNFMLQIIEIMEKHNKHDCQNVSSAPEIRMIKNNE